MGATAPLIPAVAGADGGETGGEPERVSVEVATAPQGKRAGASTHEVKFKRPHERKCLCLSADIVVDAGLMDTALAVASQVSQEETTGVAILEGEAKVAALEAAFDFRRGDEAEGIPILAPQMLVVAEATHWDGYRPYRPTEGWVGGHDTKATRRTGQVRTGRRVAGRWAHGTGQSTVTGKLAKACTTPPWTPVISPSV